MEFGEDLQRLDSLRDGHQGDLHHGDLPSQNADCASEGCNLALKVSGDNDVERHGNLQAGGVTLSTASSDRQSPVGALPAPSRVHKDLRQSSVIDTPCWRPQFASDSKKLASF